jgi:glycosyltransferase involved in cell wall biosynthesis
LDSNDRDPIVSVIIPCFNAARTLSRTLASVGNQTYRNLDIIIIDDGSTDSTLAIALEFAAADDRVRVLRQPNGGVASARNPGIANAAGEFIAPLDADDLWAPQKVELQLRNFHGDSDVGLVYAWFENINDDDEIFRGGFRFQIEGRVLHELCRLDFIGNGSNAMMRASAVRAVGGYDASLRARRAEGCEDWKLALQLAETCKFAVAPTILVGYRHSAGNMSNRTWQMLKSAKLVANEFAARYPHLATTLKQHMADRLFSNCTRCIKSGRWMDASLLMIELCFCGSGANPSRITSELWRLGRQLRHGSKRRVAGNKQAPKRGQRRKFLEFEGSARSDQVQSAQKAWP